ncbi:MAG: hypothetical protein JNL08_13675 [Planctomycetes bacterium]|nr:hypothetical protein [Planctomycetota bacterium]
MTFRRSLAVFTLWPLLCAATSLVQCTGDRSAAPGTTAAPLPSAPPGDPVRILISGSMLGRLEPCGCASGQLGGLARRMQHIGERRSYDLLLEGGDLVAGADELDRQKFFTAVQVLTGMAHRYDALGVGPKDLALPLDEWAAYLADTPAVACDLVSSREDWPVRPFVEKDVRGQKVRTTAMTLSLPPALQADDAPVRLLPPAEAWQRALVDADPATLRIVLLHTSDTKARELVPTLQPAPDLVVCCDEDRVEPAAHAEPVGATRMVFAGIRGRVLLEVELARTTDGPHVVTELVPLAGSKTVPGGGGDPDVKQLLLAHRDQVKQDRILEQLARQQPTPNGAAYVGSEMCKTCHPSAWEAFAASKHFHAWETLQKAEADPKRYGWPVTHYPDCVSCHVVGYREQTGFVSFDETPHLAGVGCERCHGPGSDHMQNPTQNRLGIHGGVQASVLCVQCHDYEQSPEFVYDQRWAVIRHGREPKK